MNKLVVLTGAGISAESGIQTFRDSNGLWENYRIEEVATPEAWERNPAMVREFYNMRRRNVYQAQPNPAHLALAQFEKQLNIHIITQNIDDLHERAGSEKVLHLHGEITKARSVVDEKEVYTLAGWELKESDLCSRGLPLRPHIVWFGEAVPKMEEAILIMEDADMVWVVGTSLQVYPAAGLVHYAPQSAPVLVIDPGQPELVAKRNVTQVAEQAGKAVPHLLEQLAQGVLKF